MPAYSTKPHINVNGLDNSSYIVDGFGLRHFGRNISLNIDEIRSGLSLVSNYNTNRKLAFTLSLTASFVYNGQRYSTNGSFYIDVLPPDTFNIYPSQTIKLFDTAGTPTLCKGTGGRIELSHAQATIFGGNNTVYFIDSGIARDATSRNIANIWDTGVSRNKIIGSYGLINLHRAKADVTGGGNAVYLDGSPDTQLSVWNTGSNSDIVYSSNGNLKLHSAQVYLRGGNNKVWLDGSKGNLLHLVGTQGLTDTVYGSNGTISVHDAQVSVSGLNNTVLLDNSSSNVVHLWATRGFMDSVWGSNATITVHSAQAAITGGNNSIWLNGDSSNRVVVSNTGSTWNVITHPLWRGFLRCQATISKMVWKGFAPFSLAVSTVVRTSASACAAHMAR
jgi:hypothetical protein